MSWSRGMTFKHLLTMRCSGVDKRRRWKGSGTGNIQFQHMPHSHNTNAPGMSVCRDFTATAGGQ